MIPSPGSRVRLRPKRATGDVWDLVLAGRVAIVDAVPIVLQVPVERVLASDICIH